MTVYPGNIPINQYIICRSDITPNFPHFTDEMTVLEKLSNVSKVTQLLSGPDRIEPVTSWFQNLCCQSRRVTNTRRRGKYQLGKTGSPLRSLGKRELPCAGWRVKEVLPARVALDLRLVYWTSQKMKKAHSSFEFNSKREEIKSVSDVRCKFVHNYPLNIRLIHLLCVRYHAGDTVVNKKVTRGKYSLKIVLSIPALQGYQVNQCNDSKKLVQKKM